MDLNIMIDARLQMIKSGDTSSRDPEPVLLQLQDQDRDQPILKVYEAARIKIYIGIQGALYRTTRRSHLFLQE